MYTKRSLSIADAARAGEEAIVFALMMDAHWALRERFALSDAQLCEALKRLGATRVEREDAPGGALECEARWLLRRVAQGKLPCVVHACPRWAKSDGAHPWTLPGAPHVAVVGCPLRKRELLTQRPEMRVITAREVAAMLIERGLAAADAPAHDTGAYPGRLARLIACAQALAGENGGAAVRFCQTSACVEEAAFSLLGHELRAARVCGAHRGAPELKRYDIIEPLSCAGACARG